MFRTLSRRRPPNRRGAILLVVLTLLALFAVIGLSFALYAESEATAARIHREGESRTGEEPPSPVDYVNAALRDILYPVSDLDPVAAQSGFRGYELARLMYGYNPYTLGSGGHDLSPFNGLGLFPSGQSLSLTFAGGTTAAIDRSQVVSYYYQPGDLFVIDPEWNQVRTNILDPTSFTGGTRTYRSIAPPYTYPDLKDLPLAVFNPTTGAVTQPSYYRTYGPFTSTGGAGLNTGLEPINPNWATPQGRLYIIRPRPIDHLLPAELTALGANPTPAQVQAAVASAGAFPYPPANADGTYTGDVQNIPNPQGQQKNDTMWIFPAGPVRRWNGKLYTALVAPTVIELNGRVNLSMAGNIKNNQTHASDAGGGQWVINPRWALDNNSTTGLTPSSQTAMLNILSGLPGIQGRYGMTTPQPQPDRITTLSMASFNNGLVPPSYGRADFDGIGSGTTNDRANAASTNTSPFPVYANTRYFDSTTQSTELTNHPAQFNPDFWSPIRNQTTSRTFPPFDLLRLGTRYGDQWTRYNQADLAQLAPQYLVSPNYPSGQYTTTDPANLVRMLVTTQSSSLYRPEVQAITGAGSGSPVVAPTTRLGPIDLNRPLADYRDLTAASNTPTPAALSPSNMANAAAAQIARQRFARDIFVRLVALAGLLVPSATPDAIYVNDPTQPNYGYIQFNTTVLTPARQAQFQALAQLAANIVDYIDPDDINTTFTWNPMSSDGTNTFLVNAAGMPNVGPGAGQVPPATLGNNVVFGTELPRLVVNEAYVALANNPADIGQNNATKPFRYKLWVELVNPLNTPALPPGDPVLSDGGAARLQYPAGFAGAPASGYPVYQLLVSYPTDAMKQPGTLLSAALNTTPTNVNVTGDPFQVAGLTTKIQTFNYAAPAATPSPALTGDSPNLILPVSGAQNGTVGGNIGYYVMGPFKNPNDTGFPGGDFQSSLQLADPPATPMTTVNSMVYEHSGNAQTDLNDATGQKLLSRPHTITLRRLANPYLPPNDPNWLVDANDPVATTYGTGGTYNPNAAANPYITVDFIEKVPTRDQVQVTDTGMWTNTQPQPLPSVGKRHVYGAGNGYMSQAHDGTNNANQPVTQQTAQPTMAPVPTAPAHTFFYANNPFGDPGKAAGGLLQNAGSLAWMTHLDRQLINPLEMASVSAVGPALVTQNFVYLQPPAAAGGSPVFTYNRHTAESLFLPGLNNGVLSYFGVTPLPQPTAAGTSPVVAGFLSRALDLLTVRSFLTGVPVGGREQGKLNINTLWHPALLQALLDSNSGNYFTTSDVYTLWQRLTNIDPTTNAAIGTPYTAARSRWDTTWTTAPYNATAADAPIWGLATYDPNLVTATNTSAAYNNLQRTILRSPDGNGGVSNSLLYNPNPANLGTTAGDSTHVVGVAEPLRKAWNSTTTTGNTFLVVMTVGYFEVRNTNYQPGDRVFLGKELYKEVPGDLRQKFVSVIDRSNLSLDLTSPVGTMGYLQGYTNASNTPSATGNTPSQPWFTTLTADVQPGATQIGVAADASGRVYVGGVPVTLTKNQQLWLGFGNFALNNGGGEMVTVLSVAPNPAPSGTAVVTLAMPVQRYHPAGSPVSNQLLGNPGPQPSFDYRDRRYQGVVPYCVRVTPAP
jgi:hypothetical protein